MEQHLLDQLTFPYIKVDQPTFYYLIPDPDPMKLTSYREKFDCENWAFNSIEDLNKQLKYHFVGIYQIYGDSFRILDGGLYQNGISIRFAIILNPSNYEQINRLGMVIGNDTRYIPMEKEHKIVTNVVYGMEVE